MRNSNKLVNGIGFNDRKYPCGHGNSRTTEYATWSDMLLRCTEKGWKKKPTYNGVTCSDNFKHFSFFYEWCQEQVGFKNKDENGKSWTMDKDILVKGNRLYSEDTCVFVPQRLNKLLNKRKTLRGDYPIGVCLDKASGKFAVYCKDGCGDQKFAGRFYTQEDAFQAYRIAKEDVIRQIAEQYKDQLDPRAYEALINYTVEVTD